jgi:hypothetical protein
MLAAEGFDFDFQTWLHLPPANGRATKCMVGLRDRTPEYNQLFQLCVTYACLGEILTASIA